MSADPDTAETPVCTPESALALLEGAGTPAEALTSRVALEARMGALPRSGHAGWVRCCPCLVTLQCFDNTWKGATAGGLGHGSALRFLCALEMSAEAVCLVLFACDDKETLFGGPGPEWWSRAASEEGGEGAEEGADGGAEPVLRVDVSLVTRESAMAHDPRLAVDGNAEVSAYLDYVENACIHVLLGGEGAPFDLPRMWYRLWFAPADADATWKAMAKYQQLLKDFTMKRGVPVKYSKTVLMDSLLRRAAGRVSAASLHRLVRHAISDEGQADAVFLSSFFLTYRSFTSPAELLNGVYHHLTAGPSSLLTPSERDAWYRDMAGVVRSNTVAFVEQWLTRCSRDFVGDAVLQGMFVAFLDVLSDLGMGEARVTLETTYESEVGAAMTYHRLRELTRTMERNVSQVEHLDEAGKSLGVCFEAEQVVDYLFHSGICHSREEATQLGQEVHGAHLIIPAAAVVRGRKKKGSKAQPAVASDVVFADNDAKFKFNMIRHTEGAVLPRSILPKKLARFDFDDLSEVEFARQECLLEHSLYGDIQSKELLSLAWSKKDKETRAPNILGLIHRFNQISRWVTTEVCRRTDFSDRVQCLRKMILLAEEFRKLNNLNALQAIMAGLSNNSVKRLRFTWEAVESKDKKITAAYAQLKELISFAKSFKNLRQHQANVEPPVIPFLGMYLTDLTFLHEGNPDKVDGLINVQKQESVAQVIIDLLRFQEYPYQFRHIQEVRTWLMDLEGVDDDTSYEWSLEVEPRAAHKEHDSYKKFKKQLKKAKSKAKSKKAKDNGSPQRKPRTYATRLRRTKSALASPAFQNVRSSARLRRSASTVLAASASTLPLLASSEPDSSDLLRTDTEFLDDTDLAADQSDLSLSHRMSVTDGIAGTTDTCCSTSAEGSQSDDDSDVYSYYTEDDADDAQTAAVAASDSSPRSTHASTGALPTGEPPSEGTLSLPTAQGLTRSSSVTSVASRGSSSPRSRSPSPAATPPSPSPAATPPSLSPSPSPSVSVSVSASTSPAVSARGRSGSIGIAQGEAATSGDALIEAALDRDGKPGTPAEKVQALLDSGVDINHVNNRGNTALHYVVLAQKHDMAALLLRHKPELDIQNCQGLTPLHLAALRNDVKLTKVLVAMGADPCIENASGQSPLDCAQDEAVRDVLANALLGGL